MLRISQLFIYPVKSLGGIALDKALVTDRGFQYDRRWMLVDHNNRFISQRDVHQMALLKPALTDKGIKITHSVKQSSCTIPFDAVKNEFAEVTIWDDTCRGQFVGNEADEWFSSMLEIPCRLVFMPDDTYRITDQRYTSEDSITSFSDAYPFLLIGQSSLDDLNSKLAEVLPMSRFRPNIVFTGGEPYQEDAMHTFIIGDIIFYGVKLCARCVMTTIDQENGLAGKEPLKTLARYRLKDKKIMFGQNLAHNGLGEIKIGDELQIIKLNYQDRFLVGV
ncbi:MOSC domain-containing protein [Mucilaginibacter sp. BT774]|uniref:MOSC domain-containing protein n=1 Tax=Mucilaginibacter sp. BT774 TaxID=3062276 RepID=UPI0026748741|nr:MOSC N-terminal beta barrel domain-containing protein [Mucilaginibacter sp. BT774]MDO3625248.1 MOSC domain-containing protein [Mucilaginibacter sp. BT774]